MESQILTLFYKKVAPRFRRNAGRPASGRSLEAGTAHDGAAQLRRDDHEVLVVPELLGRILADTLDEGRGDVTVVTVGHVRQAPGFVEDGTHVRHSGVQMSGATHPLHLHLLGDLGGRFLRVGTGGLSTGQSGDELIHDRSWLLTHYRFSRLVCHDGYVGRGQRFSLNGQSSFLLLVFGDGKDEFDFLNI